ncbi:hypothetical protein OS493_011246 [Desmophyllum pertusum]|uniref:Uncharacterized protein n=1 Tax=Desmophyllum pertusum TaxID=174260 RepID=A0A9W9Z1Y2_9CNID|nr:hypothetical protein OS493_011246 [Desmophyllum pertusum]
MLPSISLSTSTLYPSIQDLTSSTNGGFATAKRSTKLANNGTSSAQLPGVATLSLSSISSILKTETSVLSISETRMIINHTTTVPLGSSQSVSASQTNIDVVMSTVSSNYSSNISAASSSFVNPNSSSTVMVLSEVRTSTASSLQTSVMPHLTPVVSLAANLSGSVSATRTLSSAIAKATPSQSHLSHTVTINGSSTGSPSQSIAGSLTLQLETSRMVSSSSVAIATNRTLSTSYLPSSVVIKASKTVIESPSTLGTSAAISASTSTKSILDSKVASVNGTVPVTSTTIHGTPVLVTVNSSVHAVNATPTTVLTSKATISPTHSADTTLLSTFQSRSSGVNSTLQTSTVLSSVGIAVNQTRTVGDSSASLPARSIPSLNQTVSAVKTSALLQSTRALLNTSLVPTSSSVGVGEASSLVASPNATSQSSTTTMSSPIRVSSSLVVSQNATIQSSTSVSLHPSTVAAPSSTASIGVVSSIAEEKTSSVSSTVAVSSRLPVSTSAPLHTSSMAISSSVQVGDISSMATATGESSSSMPLVASSRLASSQNVTSESSLSGRLTPSSKTATVSRPSVETAASPAASVTPNKTSTDEGFIVTSYSTPCYIYYVVEKTVFPVATANHSAVPSTTSTTPKITLDIGTATRLHSGLPTVTLTHTVGMTTQVSKMQSQMPGSTDAITSSTVLVGESVKSSRLVAPTSTSTHLLSKTSISPSGTVTEVLGADTSKVVQTDSSTVPSVMSSSVSSSITSDSRNTTDASTFQTGILSTQVQSTPSQSGSLAIPRVTTSVMGLQSTSMTNKTLGSSPTILPGSFTPVVANASVSETHNMSTAIATGALSSTKQESLQSTHGSSSIVFTSSVESRAFVPTVAPSLPSQNVSSARTVSGVSQVISTDNTPVTTQASDGSVLTSKSGSIIQATASSEIHLPTTVISVSQLVTEMPSNATLSSTEIITSSESQVASSPARHTSVIGSSHVLLLNTTRLSQMPSPTSSGNLLSVVANETTTKSVSSSPVLLSSLATVSQNRTISTVSLSAIGSSTNSSSVGSVEQISSLAQSSSMSQLAVSSSSSVQMLPSSDTHASPSTSPVMETLSTIVPQVSAMSTQITSSSPSPAGNKTTASSIEMVPSSAAIHPASNTSSSVGEPLSTVMLSQAGTASTPTSNNTQVAPSSSLSQAGNKTSASSTQMLPSSSIHMLPSVNTSTGEPLSSAMLSLSTTVSQAGGMSILVNSSLQVAVSSSFSQAVNTSSAAEPLPSSASSSSPLPVRRKKRAVVDPSNATSVIESSSSAMLTSSVGKQWF